MKSARREVAGEFVRISPDHLTGVETIGLDHHVSPQLLAALRRYIARHGIDPQVIGPGTAVVRVPGWHRLHIYPLHGPAAPAAEYQLEAGPLPFPPEFDENEA